MNNIYEVIAHVQNPNWTDMYMVPHVFINCIKDKQGIAEELVMLKVAGCLVILPSSFPLALKLINVLLVLTD